MGTLLLLLVVTILPAVKGFYVPGVAPMDFFKGDPVEIKVRIITIPVIYDN